MVGLTTEFHGFSGAGCEAESWSPEVLSFYGDSDAILGKMDKFDMNLSKRRVFFFALETLTEAEVAFFERSSKDKYRVFRWKGKPSPELSEQINNAIISNKGVACVGEQTKSILKKIPNMKDEGEIPAPVSARAAFSHQVMARKDAYMKTSAYLMC